MKLKSPKKSNESRNKFTFAKYNVVNRINYLTHRWQEFSGVIAEFESGLLVVDLQMVEAYIQLIVTRNVVLLQLLTEMSHLENSAFMLILLQNWSVNIS